MMSVDVFGTGVQIDELEDAGHLYPHFDMLLLLEWSLIWLGQQYFIYILTAVKCSSPATALNWPASWSAYARV